MTWDILLTVIDSVSDVKEQLCLRHERTGSGHNMLYDIIMNLANITWNISDVLLSNYVLSHQVNELYNLDADGFSNGFGKSNSYWSSICNSSV